MKMDYALKFVFRL